MRRPLLFMVLAVLAGAVLAATVFREQVAYAAQAVDATIIGPLDGNGNIKVHEQGTANVNVTNSSLTVAPQAATEHGSLNFLLAPGDFVAETFPSINASLITLTSMKGVGTVTLRGGTVALLVYGTDGGNVVLPLTQPLAVDEIWFGCSGAGPSCSARINIVGR